MPLASASDAVAFQPYPANKQAWGMQVWKGTAKASEHALLDVPVAITSFITDTAAPRLPTLAVAAGAHVYMFRSLRPYFKFTVPAETATAEAEEVVW